MFYKKVFFACLIFFTSSFASAQLQLGDGLASFEEERRISLDLKGMDIIEVLKTLAENDVVEFETFE